MPKCNTTALRQKDFKTTRRTAAQGRTGGWRLRRDQIAGARDASGVGAGTAFRADYFHRFAAAGVKHAKIILASTLASAAPGSLIGSARIIRDLAKEQGGQAEATIWYDGAKLPITQAARVNAMLSDAAASDDSDLRNVAHTGTCLTAIGLAIGEHTGASGPDVLSAMVTGYEAAGRMGEALNNGRSGLHASIIVAFGGTVAAAKLLKLTRSRWRMRSR